MNSISVRVLFLVEINFLIEIFDLMFDYIWDQIHQMMKRFEKGGLNYYQKEKSSFQLTLLKDKKREREIGTSFICFNSFVEFSFFICFI